MIYTTFNSRDNYYKPLMTPLILRFSNLIFFHNKKGNLVIYTTFNSKDNYYKHNQEIMKVIQELN